MAAEERGHIVIRLAEFICTFAKILEVLSWALMILCFPFIAIKVAEMWLSDLGSAIYNRETPRTGGAYPWRYNPQREDKT